jgi:hypothetical protein
MLVVSIYTSGLSAKLSPKAWKEVFDHYRVFYMFQHDIATYITLNRLEISRCPLDMM